MMPAAVSEFISWLEQYRWRWVGVLTLRKGIRLRRAWSLLREWLAIIRRDERHRISFVAVLEFGDESEHPHFHVLIAGIASRLKAYLPVWEAKAGYAKLSPFRSKLTRTTGTSRVCSAGIAYALKSMALDDFDFDADLHEQHRLVRYRRSDERAQSDHSSRLWRLGKPQYRHK